MVAAQQGEDFPLARMVAADIYLLFLPPRRAKEVAVVAVVVLYRTVVGWLVDWDWTHPTRKMRARVCPVACDLSKMRVKAQPIVCDPPKKDRHSVSHSYYKTIRGGQALFRTVNKNDLGYSLCNPPDLSGALVTSFGQEQPRSRLRTFRFGASLLTLKLLFSPKTIRV